MPTLNSSIVESRITKLKSFEFEPRPGAVGQAIRMTLLQLEICNEDIDYPADHRQDCCMTKDFYSDKRAIRRPFTNQGRPHPCRAFEIKTYPNLPRIAISWLTNDPNVKTWNINRIEFRMLEEEMKIVCFNVFIDGFFGMISHNCEWQK